jgi:hypothetical protein
MLEKDFVENQPAGTGNYVAQEGDCVLSLAERFGFFWQTIWNHPENRELKTKRGRPSILLPGDRVTIPQLTIGHVDCPTDRVHRFVRKGVPNKVRLYFQEEGEPLADMPWQASVDGTAFEGTTDSQGGMEMALRFDARECRIKVGTGESERHYVIRLGNLDPWNTSSGALSRLRNLGFLRSPSEGRPPEETAGAIREFQMFRSLEPTGEFDEPTCRELRRMHGS